MEEFTTDLAAAITNGDEEYLNERLHPAVIERFGAEQCSTHIRDEVIGDTVNWEVQSSSGPAPWDYVTDGLTTTVEDTWTVTVVEPPATEPSDLHFAPSDGTWRWFTDCGEPV